MCFQNDMRYIKVRQLIVSTQKTHINGRYLVMLWSLLWTDTSKVHAWVRQNIEYE